TSCFPYSRISGGIVIFSTEAREIMESQNFKSKLCREDMSILAILVELAKTSVVASKSDH
ncbi:hypothetical protein PJP10_32660, partial [Mycobacterium kansasii]